MKTDAVMESGDFGPAFEGESFCLVTLRVPKDYGIRAGVYTLEWTASERPAWSQPKDQDKYDAARERAAKATS